MPPKISRSIFYFISRGPIIIFPTDNYNWFYTCMLVRPATNQNEVMFQRGEDWISNWVEGTVLYQVPEQLC